MISRHSVRLPAVAVVVVAMVVVAVVEATTQEEVAEGKTVKIPTLPNLPNLVINRGPLFRFFGNNNDPNEVKVVSCGESSASAHIVWQSPKYPEWQSGLPGLCTLTLTPPENSCGLRILFVDQNLGSAGPSYSPTSSCDHNAPSFKLSYNGSVTPARCNDQTGFEGLMELNPKETRPLRLVLQLDTYKEFRFRVNLTTVACSDINYYQSPNACGIKNALVIPPSTDYAGHQSEDKKNLEEGTEEEEEEEEEMELSEELEDTTRREERMIEEEEEEEEELWDEEDEEGVSQREPRQRKKGSRRKVVMAKKLRKRMDVLSQALASAVEAGVVPLTNEDRLRRQQPWKKSDPGLWPWLVTVERKVLVNTGDFGPQQVDASASQRCTGVLLDHTHVLTPASCVLPADRTKTVRVEDLRAWVGQHETSSSSSSSPFSARRSRDPGNSYAVSMVSFSMNYDPVVYSDDVAVLTLSDGVSFDTNVRPLCLPVTYNRFQRSEGFVSGWINENQRKKRNRQSSSSSSATFVEADVSVLSRGECARNLASLPYPSQRQQHALAKQRLVCTRGMKFASPFCHLEKGALLIRKDRSQLYYLAGMMGGEGQCGVDFPNVMSEIPVSSTFLNLALTLRT